MQSQVMPKLLSFTHEPICAVLFRGIVKWPVGQGGVKAPVDAGFASSHTVVVAAEDLQSVSPVQVSLK